jgi:hypothetical protein
MAVFSSDKPEGCVEVLLRLDDGSDIPARADASISYRVRNGVWACVTDERMNVKSVPPCRHCGRPARLPMSSGGLRHSCDAAKITSEPRSDEPTLF